MKWFIAILIVVVLCSTTVLAQTPNGGAIGTDSFLYNFDIFLDKVFIGIGLENADNVAQERLAEIQEAKNLDDIKGFETAQQALNDIEDQVQDEDVKLDIDKENEDIKNYIDFTEADLIVAINDYSKIDQLAEGIDALYVKTTGFEKKVYIIQLANNKVVSIKEVDSVPDNVNPLSVAYSEILLIMKDSDYKEIKLNQLLKYKKIIQSSDGNNNE